MRTLGFVEAAESRGFRTAESRAAQAFLSSPTSEQKRQGSAEYLSISAQIKTAILIQRDCGFCFIMA